MDIQANVDMLLQADLKDWHHYESEQKIQELRDRLKRRMPMGCADCPYFVEWLRDNNDNPCGACLKMPSNKPWGCGYMEIDGIDPTKNRMWFCPLKMPEITNRFADNEGGS